MRVRVLRADAAYTATFTTPQYELPGRWLKLFESLYARLSQFGFRHEDIRFEAASAQPNDFHVSATNYLMEATLRVKLASMELWTRNPALIRGERPAAIDFIDGGMQAVRDTAQKVVIQAHTVEARGHGRISGGLIREALFRFTKTPSGMQPEGVRFSFVPSEGVTAVIDLQPSASFVAPENAWCSLAVVYPGAIAVGDVCIGASQLANKLLERAGTELDWGDEV
jgi:hypothetical protein